MKVKGEKQADVAFVIARFQVPELHPAHKDLIDTVISRHPRVVIVLGVSVVGGTRENPLDFNARNQMIREVYPDIDVVHIHDTKSNEEWSRNLDTLITAIKGQCKSAVLYGSRASFISCYSGKYPVKELEPELIISGTEIREQMSKKARPSFDFRAGVIWQAYNQYPRVCATVDIAIMCNGRLLLGRKPNEKKFRLVGGFADPKSPNFEADAIREAKEETGLDVFSLKYVGSFLVDDWRYRGTDKIKTILFIVEASQAQDPDPADDIAELKWVNLRPHPFGKESQTSVIAVLKSLNTEVEPEHIPLIQALVDLESHGHLPTVDPTWRP